MAAEKVAPHEFEKQIHFEGCLPVEEMAERGRLTLCFGPLKPGQPLTRYGLEQQAEIVRHAYFLRNGVVVEGAPPVLAYETLIAIFR